MSGAFFGSNGSRFRRVALGAATAWLICGLATVAQGDDQQCISAVEQGLTLRQKGQLRDALKVLTACTDPTCPTELRTECAQRIDAIGAAMPTLVIAAKDGAGNDLVNVTVTMDGTPLVSSLDGRPLSIDPGEHDFRFETAGQPTVEKKLVLREGEKNRTETVVLGPAPPPPPPPLAQVVVAPAPPPPVSSWNTSKTLAVASGAVGLVGLGLGAAWGGYAISAQRMEHSACSAGAPCSASNRNQSQEDYDVAQRNATGSTIALSVGAALVATGLVLWLTAPSHRTGPAAVGAVHIAPAVVVRSGGAIAVGGEL